MNILFSLCTDIEEAGDLNSGDLVIPANLIESWQQVIHEPFEDLPEESKVFARAQAEIVVNALAMNSASEALNQGFDNLVAEKLEALKAEITTFTDNVPTQKLHVSGHQPITNDELDRALKTDAINKKTIGLVMSRFMDSLSGDDQLPSQWPDLKVISDVIEEWFIDLSKVMRTAANYEQIYESVSSSWPEEEFFVHSLNQAFRSKLGIPQTDLRIDTIKTSVDMREDDDDFHQVLPARPPEPHELQDTEE